MSNQAAADVAISSASAVSWQTVFWALLLLAITAMVQPSGGVLSLPNRYSAYLRSSPILCVLDAIYLPIRILVTRILFKVTIRQAFNIAIQERYTREEDRSGGILSLRTQTLLRRVFFSVGIIGPGIKLISMKGTPWSKVWGMLFLGSFLTFELVLIFSKSASGKQGAGYVPVDRGGALTCSKTMGRAFFYAGLAIHCSVLVWAVLDIWSLRMTAYVDIDFYDIDEYVPSLGRFTPPFAAFLALAIVGVTGLLIGVIFVTISTFHVSLQQNSETNRYDGWFATICPIVCWLLLLGLELAYLGGVLYLGRMILFKTVILVDIPILLLCVGFIPGLRFCIEWVCARNRRLGSLLLVGPPDRGGLTNPEFVDSNSILSLVFFVVNLVVAALWYCFRFNTEGTISPSWT